MPQRSRSSLRRRRAELVDVELDLIVGPRVRPARDSFLARAEVELLRESWWRFRDEILADSPAGRRPWGWWRFEQDRDPPGDGVEEAALLAELGVLSPRELVELRTDARLGGGFLEIWNAVAAVIGEPLVTSAEFDQGDDEDEEGRDDGDDEG